MGIREGLNDNSRVGMGVGAAILIVAVGLIAYQLRGGGTTEELDPVTAATSAFYTDDGGKSFFKDDVNKIVPFERGGKQAYRADVFEGTDGTQFVGLIYRHTELGRRQMEDYIARKPKDADGTLRSGIEVRGGMEVRKASNEKGWMPNYAETRQRLRESMTTASGAPAKIVVP